MNKNRTYLLGVLLALLSVFFYSGYRLYSRYAYTREYVILREGEATEIYIEPDNPATRAAANYLSYTLKQTLGAECSIVTEKDDHHPCVSIFYDEEPLDEEIPVYTVAPEDRSLAIRVSSYNRCFESVKAVTDRWLQEDCGLRDSGELRISRAMVSRELSFLPTALTGTFRILTQNLYYTDEPNGHSVKERAVRFFRLVDDYQPDLIGVQECTLQWKSLLQEGLGEHYEYLGIPREGENADDTEWENAILYRKDRFRLADSGVFWLSNTPDVPQSGLKSGEVIRSCTWAVLRDAETGKMLLYSNTHLHQNWDDTYREVRARQAKILFHYLHSGENPLENYPGFLTGDFNGGMDEPFYTVVTDRYDDARVTAITNSSKVDYTWQGFGTGEVYLDYCFHSPGKVSILDYRILDDRYDGKYISDHFGILITALIN